MTMILTRVNDYLQRHRRATVIDMAHYLNTTPESLKAMLAVLERKGRVRLLPAGTSCGSGCGKCDPAAIELYEWIGEVSVDGPTRATWHTKGTHSDRSPHANDPPATPLA
jgi:hypothetical protein